MDIKFPKVLGFLNLKSGTDAVTEANLQSAEDKIALLEQEKTTAEENLTKVQGQLTTAQGDLKTATESLAKAGLGLKAEQDKVATLEQWKKNQAAADGREEDDSNNLDDTDTEPKSAWEVASASAVANARKRVGEK
jgi:DNA-binding protein H-NS